MGVFVFQSSVSCRRAMGGNPCGLWFALILLAGLLVAGATSASGQAASGQAASGQSAGQISVARDLLARGNQDRDGLELFWIAQVSTESRPGTLPAGTPAASSTHFYARRAGVAGWKEWGEVPMRTVSLASRGSQLAALLEDGSWILVSDDSTSTGPGVAVPGSQLLAFADDGRTVWALAKVPGGVARLRAAAPAPKAGPTTRNAPAVTAPATAPATSPATAPVAARTPASTAPTPATAPLSRGPSIGPAEVPLALLSFEPQGWSGEADLPAAVARPDDELSLAFVAGDAYVAARTRRARGEVRVYRWADGADAEAGKETSKGAKAGPGKHWALTAAVPLPADALDFKLLNGTPIPTLWVGGAAGPDLLYLLRNPSGTPSTAPTTRRAVPPAAPTSSPALTAPEPIELAGTRGTPVATRTAAYAMGLIRSLYVRDGKLTEQTYNRLNGAAVGAASPVPLHVEQTFYPGQVRYAVVALAMLYVIGASFRRREQMRSLDLDVGSLHLTPLGVRLLAGAIDALPALAAWVYYAGTVGASEMAGTVVGNSSVPGSAEMVLGAGILLYILHTTLSEVLTGRTLGKWIFGLRVVSLDGRPPTRGQLLTRNLLRVVDAGLYFLPVLLVPFSPLRQRPGDTAAGTIVVSGPPGTGPGTRPGDGPGGAEPGDRSDESR